MKKIISALLFALAVSVSIPVLAQERYHGGCACYGQFEGIDIDDCRRAGFGNGTGVRVQVHPPTSNGQCGADGGIFAVLPKAPDKFFGVRIGQCCDEHDINYGTCGLPQGYADEQIGNCARRACADSAYTGWSWQVKGCKMAANAYQALLEEVGVFAYNASQSKCACSPCGPELAPLCQFPGLTAPAWQWPPWQPPPPHFGGF